MLSSVEAERHSGPISESLRAAEISLQQFFASQQTRFVAVRLCDILENRGGVVAMLKEQITHLEPITLPSPESTCEVLSKEAAAHLILNSLVLAHSAPVKEAVFVSAEGSSVLLLEMAQKLAAINGLQLDTDLPLRFTQLDTKGAAPIWATKPVSNQDDLSPKSTANSALANRSSRSQIHLKSSRQLITF